MKDFKIKLHQYLARKIDRRILFSVFENKCDIKELSVAFPDYYKDWEKIDLGKDKSLAAKDFRFYLYNRMLDRMSNRAIKIYDIK